MCKEFEFFRDISKRIQDKKANSSKITVIEFDWKIPFKEHKNSWVPTQIILLKKWENNQKVIDESKNWNSRNEVKNMIDQRKKLIFISAWKGK